MTEEKYIAIGDIHGCYRSIAALLEKLEPYFDSRRFIFIGDYIDRGPASKQVVDLMLEFRNSADCIFLRGNHEQMLLDAVRKKNMSLWLMNGGGSTIDSYGGRRSRLELPEDHLEFYNNTLLYHDTPDFFFVHAGISPSKTIAESLEENEQRQEQEFLWERSHLNAFETVWEKTVVFGHTPQPQPLQKDHMLGIDTGCVYSRTGFGKLTAVKLPEVEFIQQGCLD